MPPDRRTFLAQSARLATLVAMSSAFPGLATARTVAYPFSLGVASGSPRPAGIVLWTRLLIDPFNAELLPSVPIAVRWEIAEDEMFKRIAAKGMATALPQLAHSIHVDVTGLQPDRWYWYRFMHGDAVSPTGRTRTAPAADAMPSSLRFAFASCQHWDFGHYGAHRHIAASAPDLVVFLGDYIYERGEYDLQHPAVPRRSRRETITLADYRARYAQYKSDPHLQAAHHAAPWLLTWDDHEVANDYANERDERLDENFLARRAAAYQAFYEHMPVRLSVSTDGTLRFASLRIYDRVDWGQLARFHVLDNRQYRSHQACPRAGRGGSNSVTQLCTELQQPDRTLLGREQESWLAQGLASSPARWNILAQQTLMARAAQVPIIKPDEGQFWTDGWDGYPAARKRLFDDLAKHRPANPLVISGDVHTFYAADLKADFDRATTNDNPVIATEFCGTSITSNSRLQSRTDRFVEQNPHIKYGRSDRRGYAAMDLTPSSATVQFRGLDDVQDAASAISTLASFTVENGKAGAVPDS
jgi:alkaline phosphatase D